MKDLKLLTVLGVSLLLLIVGSATFNAGDDIADFNDPAATLAARLATLTPAPTPTSTCQLTPASRGYNYRSGAPFTTHLPPPPDYEGLGQRLIISGRVFASDCTTPLPNALLEVWHANPDGSYSRADDFTLRGSLRTDSTGLYRFATIAPGRYRSGESLLPAHIHFRVSHPHLAEPLFTQLFFADDPSLAEHPLAVPPLVATLRERPGANGVTWRADFNLALAVPLPAPRD